LHFGEFLLYSSIGMRWLLMMRENIHSWSNLILKLNVWMPLLFSMGEIGLQQTKFLVTNRMQFLVMFLISPIVWPLLAMGLTVTSPYLLFWLWQIRNNSSL
jgi:prepilin signal peptidase PulO-like enzyme (type II secretory pathway)